MCNDDHGALLGIPGIALHYPNSHVGTLKRRPWSDLPSLLGKDGEQIMLDLLLECAVYAGVENGQGNFYQLSGKLTSNNAITDFFIDMFRSPIDRITAHDSW